MFQLQFIVANISLNAIHENKILSKISELFLYMTGNVQTNQQLFFYVFDLEIT